MNILITGGKGFIGNYIAHELAIKHNITVIDNGFRDAKLLMPEGIKVIHGDITNYDLIKDIINECDCVIHLAGISQVMTSIKYPDLTFDYNIRGTETIAKACYENEVKLLFSSSREVYGTQDSLPVRVNAELRPENPYAASKISGEMIIKAYSNTYGLEYGIFRLSNVYGYGDSGRVLPIFIDNAIVGKDLQIYGDNKIIDFVHVTDVTRAISKMLKVNENFTLNIGSGIGRTLEDIATLVKIYTDNKISIKHLGSRTGEVDSFVADITKTFQIIKWKPEIDLEEGVKNMIEETIQK